MDIERIRTETEITLFDRGLPKWPQMRVEGVPVSVEQAKEIIRRTDTFFSYPDNAGNDADYDHRVMKKLGIPKLLNQSVVPGDIGESWEAQDRWRKSWGFIETSYVHNTWMSSSFVFGPHGWCHPDGQISYTDNVGKWPSIQEVYDDWSILAKAFPFLNLVVFLMDREECEDGGIPVVGFQVFDGSVKVFDPSSALSDVQLGQIKQQRPPIASLFRAPIFGNGLDREHGIPWAWIEDWSKRPKFILDASIDNGGEIAVD